MYDNILGQYYDCVFLLPEDMAQPPSSRPRPQQPNHVSLRDLQLQYPLTDKTQWTPSRFPDGPPTPATDFISSPNVVCEQLEDEAARLIRDVAAGAGAGAGAGESRRTSGEESRQSRQVSQEAQSPRQQHQEKTEEDHDVEMMTQHDEEIVDVAMSSEENLVNEYSELERILTTFIYEAPKKKARL